MFYRSEGLLAFRRRRRSQGVGSVTRRGASRGALLLWGQEGFYTVL